MGKMRNEERRRRSRGGKAIQRLPTCNATTRRSRFIVPQHSTALRRVHKLSRRRSHSQGAAVDRQTDGRQRRQIDRQTERDRQTDRDS